MEQPQSESTARRSEPDFGASPAAGRAAGTAADSPQPSPAPQHRERESIPHLLRQLSDQITHLFTKEMALARSEVRQAVGRTKIGIGSVATGGAVLFGGFLVLLAAAVAGLTLVLSLWLAALIVGGVTAIVGAVMLGAGKKKLDASALKPDRTTESLHRDSDLVKTELEHGRQGQPGRSR